MVKSTAEDGIRVSLLWKGKRRQCARGRMEQQVYQMYLEELEGITPLDSEEKEMLLVRLAQGEQEAAARLIEGSLHRVLELVKAYTGKNVLIEDLVQEGNMALALAVSDYVQGDFDTHIALGIQKALDYLIIEQQEQAVIEEEVLARVNVLQKVSQVMAEELDREATVEELAEKMKMTAEEIKSIMKLTLDAMSVSGE